jgi:VCBS repeat-containing protein
MSDEHQLSRREFTVEWALAMLAGATITISGCGGDDDNPTANPSPQPGSHPGTISANHGHEVTITAADVNAGTGKTALTIRGSATHSHTIDLSAAQIVSIGQNQRVSVTSTSEDAHNHTVTFN